MCIALISTSHPKYPFILANNRDEFIDRPTKPADWWVEPNAHVLGGRDLQREIQGTWLGITEQGRIAVLTNFREEGQDVSGLKSRGGIVNSFLTTPPDSRETTEAFAKRLVEEVGVKDVGGFSLAFGQLRSPRQGTDTSTHEGLAIVSNRTPDARGVVWIADSPGQTYGLSNSHYGDESWPKVTEGKRRLAEIIHANVESESSKEELQKDIFNLLSIDTLPKRKEGEELQTYFFQLRNSIFIPKVGDENTSKQPADTIAAADSNSSVPAMTQGCYATQKQTVILVDAEGHVTFLERTLYDQSGQPVPKDHNTRAFEFDFQGWND